VQKYPVRIRVKKRDPGKRGKDGGPSLFPGGRQGAGLQGRYFPKLLFEAGAVQGKAAGVHFQVRTGRAVRDRNAEKNRAEVDLFHETHQRYFAKPDQILRSELSEELLQLVYILYTYKSIRLKDVFCKGDYFLHQCFYQSNYAAPFTVVAHQDMHLAYFHTK